MAGEINDMLNSLTPTERLHVEALVKAISHGKNDASKAAEHLVNHSIDLTEAQGHIGNLTPEALDVLAQIGTLVHSINGINTPVHPSRLDTALQVLKSIILPTFYENTRG